MRLTAILRKWIETLATVFVAWRESRREQYALVVAFENQDVVVQGSPTGRNKTRLHFRAGQKISADLLGSAHHSFIVLKFPAEKVVRRDINVPAQAGQFLPGVIRNQIERLSPWPANNVLYGFKSEKSGEGASVIDVQVLMASRADIDASRQQLAELGIQVDRIVAACSSSEAPDNAEPVILWSRSTDALHTHLEKTARALGAGIAAVFAISVCVSLWASISTGLVRDEMEGIAARAKALQRQFQGGRTLSSLSSMPAADRAWFLKESSVSSVILLEALSRALPDSAYLTEMRLENTTLRMTGLADDAPGLLAPLEQSGHLTGVRFSAPTTRGPDGRSFRFSIEAQVEPRSQLAAE